MWLTPLLSQVKARINQSVPKPFEDNRAEGQKVPATPFDDDGTHFTVPPAKISPSKGDLGCQTDTPLRVRDSSS